MLFCFSHVGATCFNAHKGTASKQGTSPAQGPISSQQHSFEEGPPWLGRGKGNTQDHQKTLKDPCSLLWDLSRRSTRGSVGVPCSTFAYQPVGNRKARCLHLPSPHTSVAVSGLASFTCSPESAAPEPAQERRSQKLELLHHLLGNKRKVCNCRSVEQSKQLSELFQRNSRGTFNQAR